MKAVFFFSLLAFSTVLLAKNPDLKQISRTSYDSLNLVDISNGFDGMIIRYGENHLLEGLNSIYEIKLVKNKWDIKKYTWGYEITEKKRKFLFLRWTSRKVIPIHYSRTVMTERNIVEVVHEILDLGIASLNTSEVLPMKKMNTEDEVEYTVQYAESACFHQVTYFNPELLDQSFVEVKTILKIITIFESEFDTLDY